MMTVSSFDSIFSTIFSLMPLITLIFLFVIGMLVENDRGKLTFQGTRYLGFQRERSQQ